MTFSGDPYRTLGLQPGATLDEIKRAYRRLAKQYHPDSAGPAATRRFLVIQGAYEALVRTRDGGHERGSAGASPSSPDRGRARRPWEADPDRARSTRERYAGRGWGRGRSEPGSGRRGDTDASQGAGRGTDTDASQEAGRGTTAGSRPNGESGGRSSGRPGGGQASGRGHPSGDEPGSAAPGGRPSSAGSGGASGRRSAPRARPGSTSYDGIDADGRTPPWDGATWYGAASGTYWTINPKEYADPRKHGPEYLQRGRRGTGRADDETPPEDDRGSRERGARERMSTGDDGLGTMSSRPMAGRVEETPPPDGAPGDPGSARAPGRTEPGRAEPGDRRSAPRHGPSGAADSDRSRLPWESLHEARAEPSADRVTDHAASSLPQRDRIVLAALGWPPLGFAAIALMGDATGCARFSAACGDTGGPAAVLGPLAIQVVIFGMLLALPALARPTAVGTLAVLAAAVPAAIVLVSFGGARAQAESQVLLLALLALAYGAGIGVALAWSERLPEPFGRRRMGG